MAPLRTILDPHARNPGSATVRYTLHKDAIKLACIKDSDLLHEESYRGFGNRAFSVSDSQDLRMEQSPNFSSSA